MLMCFKENKRKQKRQKPLERNDIMSLFIEGNCAIQERKDERADDNTTVFFYGSTLLRFSKIVEKKNT